MSDRGPPRPVEWLLERRLSGDAHRASTLGDLAEGHAQHFRSAGRVRANFWYARQTMSLLLRNPGAPDENAGRARASLVERYAHDFRMAARALARRRGFTLAVAGVLVAAMGAAAAAFSLALGTFESARWWRDDARSVLVWPEYPFSRGQLDVLQQESEAFEAIGGILRQPAVVTSSDGTVTASVAGVALSVELFDALRHRPLIGPGLVTENGEPGTEPVAVLGYGLWRRTFGADPAIVGRIIDVNGVARRVVGVMPPGAEQPGPGSEIWLPLVMDPRDPDFWPARELSIAAVMKPGVSMPAARDDVRRVLQGLARRYPFFFRPDYGLDATLVASAERSWAGVATPLLLLVVGTAVLLLVAAIDVGNVVLARSLDRGAELKVRMAIGASRLQVVRQIAIESLLLAVVAGAGGWSLGAFLATRLPGLFPADAPVVPLPPAHPAALATVAALTTLAWAMIAGIPVAHFLSSTRRALSPRVRRGRASQWLVSAQAAFAMVLLVIAALLIRSVATLERMPLGFEPADVVSVRVAPSTTSGVARLQDAVAERLAAMPGVEASGWISTVPLRDPLIDAPVNLEEAPVDVAAAPTAIRVTADAGALAALGIDVVSGRGFTAADRADAAGVVLVNETLARLLWPDGNPLGRRIAVDPHGWNQWLAVVGVVRDVRIRDLTTRVPPTFFLPRAQASAPSMSLVVRSPASPAALVGTIRTVLAEVAPGTPAGDARTMVRAVQDAQGIARVLTTLLGLLAVLATCLGAVGLHGALAGWVARRRVEIGTRMALGASPAQLSTRVFATGLLLTAAGVAAGIVLAAAVTPVMRVLLFGISPLDPLAFVMPAIVLGTTAVLAAAAPALRAAAVPPAQALRD